MKKILLSIVFLAFASVANAQLSTETSGAFEMPLGTFQGSGKIAGGVHTIKIYSTLGSAMVTYGGATKCTAMLQETEHPGVYQEIDYYSGSTGKVAADSCKEKGFVFLNNQGTGLVYHWGSTADEAMDKPMPVTLKRIKK